MAPAESPGIGGAYRLSPNSARRWPDRRGDCATLGGRLSGRGYPATPGAIHSGSQASKTGPPVRLTPRTLIPAAASR